MIAGREQYLVCYDINESRRLRRALVAAREFSIGGQRSVHECQMSLTECSGLVERLAEVLDTTGDRALILKLDPRQAIITIGRAESLADEGYVYVG